MQAIDADREPRKLAWSAATVFLVLGGGCLVAFAMASEVGRPLAWLVVLGIGFLALSERQQRRLLVRSHREQVGLLEERVQHLERGINALVESRQRALLYWAKTKGAGSKEVAESLFHLAFIKSDLGHNDEAEPLYREALSIWEDVLGPESEEVADCLSNLAKLYEEEGAFSEAEPMYQRALAIMEKLFGPEHPAVAISLSNLAFYYNTREDYAQAESFTNRAISIYESKWGPDHPDLVVYLDYHASLLRCLQRNSEVESVEERVRAIRAKIDTGKSS